MWGREAAAYIGGFARGMRRDAVRGLREGVDVVLSDKSVLQ